MNNQYILCPVCGKHKFPSFEDNGTCICPNCGWAHDSISEKDPFEAYGPNDLCLNDYKLRYDFYVSKNPCYHWKNDGYPKLPQIEPIVCPVCGKYHFEEMTLEDICCGIVPSDISCRMCGWHYNVDQQSNPNLKGHTNAMSLNDYRKWYQDKVLDNPNYIYFEDQTDNYIPTPHKCPVCEKYTFEDESSYDICPFCGWEDDGLMEKEPNASESGVNDLCLNMYIERYKNFVKLKPNYKFKKDGLL